MKRRMNGDNESGSMWTLPRIDTSEGISPNLEPTSKFLAPEEWHGVPQSGPVIYTFLYMGEGGGRNNYRRHRTKFILAGDQVPGICGPLSCPIIRYMEKHLIRITDLPGNSCQGHTRTQLREKPAAGSNSYGHCSHNNHKFPTKTELPSHMRACI